MSVRFEEQLAGCLPSDLPHRQRVLSKAAEHLELIADANRQFNLTRIVSPGEAAIKHVLDSVLPWRLFSEAEHVLDAGSGAGFPGVPLALVLPGARFTLAESIQKKARFLETAVDALEIANVHVEPHRAEDVLLRKRIDLITARAVAPLARALELFGPAVKAGARALFYKGPDVAAEIAAAAPEAARRRVRFRIVERYQLPQGMGERTIVEMTR